MSLGDYKEKDLQPISALNSISKLTIKTASIETIAGIENLLKLEGLFLGNCRKLKSISLINNLLELKSLHIESCSKISDYQTLNNLPNLQKLYLINCKDIQSISFVKKLPSLKEIALSASTNVIDGDMTPIKDLDKIFYNVRKHYNLKDLDLKNIVTD